MAEKQGFFRNLHQQKTAVYQAKPCDLTPDVVLNLPEGGFQKVPASANFLFLVLTRYSPLHSLASTWHRPALRQKLHRNQECQTWVRLHVGMPANERRCEFGLQ